MQVSADSFLNCYVFKVSSGCNLHLSGIPCKEVFICQFKQGEITYIV